jgi:hypothetical protein
VVTASVVLVYFNRVPPVKTRPILSLADWGECAVLREACAAHETPFAVIGVGSNKCELQFMCSTPTGRQFVAGICKTVGEGGC